jgi:hypothetical protein
MKIHLTIIFLLTSICSWGQGRHFKDLNDFTNWMTNYYKHPEPQYLFDAFKYGSSSQEIANSGSRSNLAAFFASSLRGDTTQQFLFFSQLKETTNEDFIYGFGLTLWLIHTDHSSALLQRFLNLNQIKKYQKEFELITNAKYPDIWADPIIGAAQLDILWADFFATGNDKSILKIISVLKDVNSSDHNSKIIAGSAKWSLTSNAIRHDKVLSICQNQKDNADKELMTVLDEIVKTAKKQRGG